MSKSVKCNIVVFDTILSWLKSVKPPVNAKKKLEIPPKKLKTKLSEVKAWVG